MAQQETYGNWLGAQSLQRPPGIYSVPRTMPPLGDFRPASPASFDSDYDDVSMAGSERGPPPKGVYLLAGPPGSSPALQDPEPQLGNSRPNLGNSRPNLGNPDPKFGNSEQKFGNSDPKFGNCDRKLGNCDRKFGNCDRNSGRSRGRFRNPALLGALALLGLAWGALLGTGVSKYLELRLELERLRGNFSGIWDAVQQDQTRLHFGIRQHQLEQQELAAQLCRALGSSQPCSPGWISHRSRCFSFSRDALSWGRAHNACADLGAHLAVVSDEDEQVFLLEHSNRSSSYWLGLTDAEHSGKWRWVTGEEPKYTFWDAWLQEEQAGPGNCGALGPKGRWVSAACAEPRRWICQRANRC